MLATWSCTTTLTSSVAGNNANNAMTTVTITPGILFKEKTAWSIEVGLEGRSVHFRSTFVDANIQISPTNASNAVGTAHVLTGHVNVNDGTGFVNAPADRKSVV